DHLFVRVADHVLAAVVVLRPERDRLERVPPPGLLPVLRRRQDRHLHLLGADPVLLLADDLLHLLRDAEPQWQPAVEAGRERSCDRRPEHELVARRLRFGWWLAEGAADPTRHAPHATWR